MTNITTAAGRTTLAPRREPYWHRIDAQYRLGYRQLENGGTWIARAYDQATGKRVFKSLGTFGELTPGEQFSAALKAANAWFEHLGRGGRKEVRTVLKACEDYVDQLESESAKADAKGRIRRHIEGDQIAAIDVAKLTRQHIEKWRKRLADKPAVPARRGPNCRVKEPQETRERSASAINRDMVPLRAALNLAHRNGYATSDNAWRVALEPIAKANKRRDTYLTRGQRRALLENLTGDMHNFAKGLCLLPLRPGALAGLVVADFDARKGTLRIEKDKSNGGRSLLLPENVSAYFKSAAKDKLPSAPLISCDDGSAWNKDKWKKPFKAAAISIGVPQATAYSLRHSTITDLVSDGLDLFTVAKLAGTSVAMIEKHYGHLQQDRAQKALAGLAL